MLDKIERILDEKVRPELALHHGNVEVISYQNSILRIKLLGQCSGCPSALLTTEELIGREIKENIHQVKDVILVTEVSDDLINTAKQILSGAFLPC